MKHEPITLFVVILTFVIIVGTLLYVNAALNKFKSFVNSMFDKYTSYIPNFIKREHFFGKLHWKHTNNKLCFDIDNIVNLALLNMCVYNLYNRYKSKLHKNMSVIKKIKSHGYLFKSDKTNDYVIAYRGTVNGSDIRVDLDLDQIQYGNRIDNNMVHRGFYDIWKNEFDKKDFSSIDKDANIYITGHSLGCAFAIFTSLELVKKYSNVHLYLFAPPRVGNNIFCDYLDNKIVNFWAIINKLDVIPTLPLAATPTLNGTWYYDDYKRIKYIEIQMGSLIENHHLDTYAAGIIDIEHIKPIWKREI